MSEEGKKCKCLTGTSGGLPQKIYIKESGRVLVMIPCRDVNWIAYAPKELH